MGDTALFPGSGTKADPYTVQPNALAGDHETVHIDAGWYEIDGGLATDASFAYDETSVYLVGEGVRTTTLLHAADAPTTPTVQFQGQSGNHGGLRNMTVFGAGEGDQSGSANIVDSDGNPFDLEFENVLIRYGGGDALHIGVSGSGTRVVNSWLESCGGWGLNLDNGSRVKVDNVHLAGTAGGGIRANCSDSNITNVTVVSTGGAHGIESSSSFNTIQNVFLEGVGVGVEMGSPGVLDGLVVDGTTEEAVLVGAADVSVSNVIGNYGDAAGDDLVGVFANNVTVQNAVALSGGTGRSLLTIGNTASNCYVNGLAGDDPTLSWTLTVETNCVENVLDNVRGVAFADITDNGTRTLINRWGTNAGDPNSAGQWNGHAGYAGEMGATVWDTSVSPWRPYVAAPNGSWISLCTC